MRSFRIVHCAGRTTRETELVARNVIGVQTCYRWVCLPPLGIEVQAVSLSPYRSGVAEPHRTRFPVLPALPTCYFPLALSGLGELVRLAVNFPELRPPVVAIHSVRDMAHGFLAHGSGRGIQLGRLIVRAL